MATLTRIELAAGGATVVLAALVLLLVVRVALAPLGKMTALAHRIRGGARGGRLHPTKPQTGVLDVLPLRRAVSIRSTSEGRECRRQTLSGLFARDSLLSSTSTRRRSEIVKLF